MANFDFSVLNFDVLDLSVSGSPDIYINQNGVTFSKAVLETMDFPSFVQCQLDSKRRVFAIRACKSNERKAVKFSKPKDEQKSTLTINNKNLVAPIRKVMEGVWEDTNRYRVAGIWVSEEKTLCFELEKGTQEIYRRSCAKAGKDE